jgi:hypothetical protein
MGDTRQLVVQYLYVHDSAEEFEYPTSRSLAGPERLAARYLECALVQAASLRLREVDCDLAFVTNVSDRSVLGARGERLLAEIEALGVEIVIADYEHRPAAEQTLFASSMYVFDAIAAAAAKVPSDTQLWLMDVDCVWLDAPRLFAAAPSSPGIGCIYIQYPPDWDVIGMTTRSMGEVAHRMGGPDAPLAWVGGELLSGSAGDLLALVSSCETLASELIAAGEALATEEQLLSFAGALGRVQLHDLSAFVQRVWTGPRHGAPTPSDLESLCVLHLPSEKGLGFRRTAHAITSGHQERLRADLDVRARTLKRFNVKGAGPARRVRDDSWLLAQRLREKLASRGS